MIDIEKLITNVMDYAMNVRKQLVPGYEEKVYRNALLIEIRKHGIECEAEVPFSVLYDGISVGDYKADIIVEKRLVIASDLSSVSSGNRSRRMLSCPAAWRARLPFLLQVI